MAAYHLWHPAYVSGRPRTVEAFVTLGDALFLSRGTDPFVRAALAAIGVDGAPLSWRMQAVRTPYFNSHRERSADWEDAWDLAWRLRAVIDEARPPVLAEPPGPGCFDLDAADGSWRPDDAPQAQDGWPCLVIADALDSSTIDAARALVASRHPRAACERGRAFGRYPQLRCDLGWQPRAFYEQGAAPAEALLGELAALGASVRFHGLPLFG